MARVLVVDDAAFMRKMVGDALSGGGHEIVGEAGNGAEAVQRYQELRPDVMTLDITMPEKDGLAALREIIAVVGMKRFMLIPKLYMKAIMSEQPDLGERVKTLVSFAERARKDGLLALEEEIEQIEEPFMRKGMQLVVDGTDPELLREILDA